MSRRKNAIAGIFLFLLFMKMCMLTVFAEGVLYSSLDVPQQVMKGKSITAGLTVNCDKPIGVVIFNVRIINGFEYKDCKVNDGSSGYIVSCFYNNELKITYVNPSGIDVSAEKRLVDIRLKASENICTGELEVLTTDAAGLDEKLLENSQGMKYSIDITDKVTSTSAAAGRRTASQNSSESRTTSADGKSNTKSVPAQRSDKSDNTEEILSEELSSQNTSSARTEVTNSDNSFSMFIMGGAFASGMALVIFVSYRLGKSHSRDNNQQKNEQIEQKEF